MSENEIFENDAVSIKVEPDQSPEPPKRAKKELTAERKAELLERLRKGKERARAKREAERKTKLEAAAAKQEDGRVKPAAAPEVGNGVLLNEVRAMRSELKTMREEKAARRKAKEAKARTVSFKTEDKPVPKNDSLSEPQAAPSKPAPKAAYKPPAPAQPRYEERWDARTNKLVRKRVR
jgi:hypothetical protein